MLILRILPILLPLILGPDIYLHFHGWKHKSLRMKLLLWLPDVALLLFAIFFCLGGTSTPKMLSMAGIFFFFLLCYSIPKLLWVVLMAFRLPQKMAGSISVVTALTFIYGFMWGSDRIVTKHEVYKSALVPQGFDGYRIAIVSDLHVGTYLNHPSKIEKIVETVNQQHPDAIFFLGDIVNLKAEELDHFVPVLQQLKARDGVFAVLGNHDYCTYAPLSVSERRNNVKQIVSNEEQMGWHLLLNSNAILQRGTDSLAVVGVENDGKPPFPALSNLPKALKGTEGMMRILLSHDPSHWRRGVLGKTDIPLTLSGHTHGMQFECLGWSPAKWFYPEWQGWYTENEQQLFVTIGAGDGLIPFRLGAWSEVVMLTLQHAE